MKTTITTLLSLTLVIAVFAPAKAEPVKMQAEKQVVRKSIEAVSNPTVNSVEKCADELKCNEQNAQQAASSNEGQLIKYGTVIQDGQIMIIQNKPVRLFA